MFSVEMTGAGIVFPVVLYTKYVFLSETWEVKQVIK